MGMSPASQEGRDAILQTDLRLLGTDVLPFNGSKQNAVIVGVANVLGNAVALSDIQLTVVNTYPVIFQPVLEALKEISLFLYIGHECNEGL